MGWWWSTTAAAAKRVSALPCLRGAFSRWHSHPTGRCSGAAGDDRRIYFLDLAAGKVLDSLLAHQEPITSLAFSPDGKTLYSGSYDGVVKIWDAGARKLVQTLTANGGRIHGVAVSADGKKLAAACAANLVGEVKLAEIALWKLDNTKERQSLHAGAADFTAVQFSGPASMLAAARTDGWVLAWSADGIPCSRLKAHQNRITSLAFAPNGKSLVTTSWEPRARLWNLPQYPMPAAMPGENKNPATLVYDRHANLLVAGGMDKAIRILDPAGKIPERRVQLKADNTLGLAVSSDGKLLATTSGRENGMPQPGIPVAVQFGIGGGPPAVPKPELITLWEFGTGKEVRTLAGHRGPIHVVAFAPSSLLLASGSADKTVRLWNAATGVEQMQLIGHTAPVVGLAFHPNGKTLASGFGRRFRQALGPAHRSGTARVPGARRQPEWPGVCARRTLAGDLLFRKGQRLDGFVGRRDDRKSLARLLFRSSLVRNYLQP